jgi:endonuclease G
MTTVRLKREQGLRIAVAVALCVLIAAGERTSRADYVEASRRALVKSAPSRDAVVVTTLDRGGQLELSTYDQVGGYYEVKVPGAGTAWVYRTFVRRFPGGLPSGSGGVPGGESLVVDADKGLVYASDPVSTTPGSAFTVLDKSFFRIGYSDEHANPLWTCYAIGPANDLKAYPRKRFATDGATAARVSHDDYTNQDYSRGHMAPRFAISSRYGKAGNDATFVMSNVCPQFQDFNDGPWGNLEEWVAGRKANTRFIKGWADQYAKVWVTVGPIFSGPSTRFADRVEVPSAYYCIVVDEENRRPRALAFVFQHEDTRESDIVGSLRSIDEIEGLTGLDFFSALPDAVENALERSVASALWPLPESPN